MKNNKDEKRRCKNCLIIRFLRSISNCNRIAYVTTFAVEKNKNRRASKKENRSELCSCCVGMSYAFVNAFRIYAKRTHARSHIYAQLFYVSIIFLFVLRSPTATVSEFSVRFALGKVRRMTATHNWRNENFTENQSDKNRLLCCDVTKSAR